MLAIMSGTGIYNIEGLETLQQHHIDTPFGRPSAPIVEAQLNDNRLLFLPRHGTAHQFLPHEINYRANIFALKSLGATQVLGLSAIGSLREDIHPEDLAIPRQYFDFIKGPRHKTFFGEGVAAHVSTAEPSCQRLTQRLTEQAGTSAHRLHIGKTYACVDGPRLGTKAESQFLRQIGCDLVGMTNVPEAFLAREAQLCYATLGIVTDYDCWMEDPQRHVSVADVIARYGQSLMRVKKLLMDLLVEHFPEAPECECRHALSSALLTPEEAIPEAKRHMLKVLIS